MVSCTWASGALVMAPRPCGSGGNAFGGSGVVVECRKDSGPTGPLVGWACCTWGGGRATCAGRSNGLVPPWWTGLWWTGL